MNDVQTFQSRVRPWMLECFGAEIAADRLERGDRFLEEALELLQSGDYPRDRIAALVDYVYGRPAGEPPQEVGGVMVTLAAYCLAHDLDMHAAAEAELARILQPEIVERIRAKQAAKPSGSALPVASAPQGGGDEALKWFLKVIESAGGEICSSESRHNPINVFCDDRTDGDDTFNISEAAGFTQTSHDTSFDTSTTRITEKGRAYLAVLSPGAGEQVAWMCKTCNGPRAKAPCHKCGGELTKPADGWEWPDLPDVDRIRELAREVGYGIGVHGSLERDLDLIAAPWIVDAVSPERLAEHIAKGLPGRIAATFDDAPHGRAGFNIKPDGWFKMIDLSVMPILPLAPPSSVRAGA